MTSSRPPKSVRSEPGPGAAYPRQAPDTHTPANTSPTPTNLRGAWFDEADPVTSIRELDGSMSFELPLDRERRTIGASRDCTFRVVDRGLSATHGAFERRGQSLRLIDQATTNGTYFQDRRVADVTLTPGAVFTLGTITFVAQNAVMERLRPAIVEGIGTGFDPPSPDTFMVEFAMSASHLLLVGEADCGQESLAKLVHEVSLRRVRRSEIVRAAPDDRAEQRAIIDRASRSTLILPIADDQRPLDPTFCSMLLSPSYHIRLIVIASTSDVARRVMTDEAVKRTRELWIRPLALRSHDIDRLLDRELEERGSPVRWAQLTPRNRAALSSYSWPNNFHDLRYLAELLTAVCGQGVRPAAKALGLAKATLQAHLKRFGLEHPWLVE